MLYLAYSPVLLQWLVIFGDSRTDIDGFWSFENLDFAREILHPMGLGLKWKAVGVRKVVRI